MQKRTKRLLEQLGDISWFSQAGSPCGDTVIQVKSWTEAIKKCKSKAWEAIQHEGQNQLRGRINANYTPKPGEWNKIVGEVRPAIVKLIARKAKSLIAEHKLPEAFENDVRWNLMHACMESEYAHVVPPGFFTNLLFWYLRGHFPCGAQGPAKKVDVSADAYTYDVSNLYKSGFYDPIAKWYEKGDFGDWQGAIPKGKLIVY